MDQALNRLGNVAAKRVTKAPEVAAFEIFD